MFQIYDIDFCSVKYTHFFEMFQINEITTNLRIRHMNYFGLGKDTFQ